VNNLQLVDRDRLLTSTQPEESLVFAFGLEGFSAISYFLVRNAIQSLLRGDGSGSGGSLFDVSLLHTEEDSASESQWEALRLSLVSEALRQVPASRPVIVHIENEEETEAEEEEEKEEEEAGEMRCSVVSPTTGSDDPNETEGV
jgi:hypothetical protein